MLLLLALIAGIWLGLYFSFLVMLPLAAVGGCAFICLSSVLGLSGAESLKLTVLATIALQGGYMMGVTARDSRRTLMQD